jgi:SP family general alpha glucoside:H+ symporter-like MFS transporter
MEIGKKEALGETRVEHEDDKANIQQLHDAQAANAEEHNTTLRQALRENWKAVLWSAAISLTIVMEGYDQRYLARPWPLNALFNSPLTLDN